MNYIRYGIIFVGIATVTSVIVALLNTTMASTLGSSAQIVVPAMIAALIEGQQFAKRQKRKPATGEAWNFTWIATLIAAGLNVGLAFLGPAVVPEFAKLAIAAPLSQQFNILLAIYAGGYLICNRFFLSIGASNQLSAMRSRGEIE